MTDEPNSSMFTQWPDHHKSDISGDELAGLSTGTRIVLRLGAIPYHVETRVLREYDEIGSMSLERTGEAPGHYTTGSTPDVYQFNPHTGDCDIRIDGRDDSVIESIATPIYHGKHPHNEDQ